MAVSSSVRKLAQGVYLDSVTLGQLRSHRRQTVDW